MEENRKRSLEEVEHPQPGLPNWCSADEFKSMLECIPEYRHFLKNEASQQEIASVLNQIVPGGETEWVKHGNDIVNKLAKFQLKEQTTVLELANQENQDRAATVIIPGVMEFLEKPKKYERSYFAQKWQKEDQWYYTDSDNKDEEPPEQYVFRPALIELHDGIIRPPGIWDPANLPPESLVKDLRMLSKTMEDEKVICASDDFFPYKPLLVPWPEEDGETMTPATILKRMGAHPKIVRKIYPEFENGEWLEYPEDEDEEGELPFQGVPAVRRTVYAFFLEHTNGAGPIAFHAGQLRLNPYPNFIVAKLAPGFVGGFISAYVATG